MAYSWISRWLLCFVLWASSAAAEERLVINGSNLSVDLLPEFSYFHDETGELQLGDIRGAEFSSNMPAFEAGEALWLKLDLQLAKAGRADLFLEFVYLRADYVDAYLLRGEELVWQARQGNFLPKAERQLPSAHPTFKFSVDSAPHTLFVRTTRGVITEARMTDTAGYLTTSMFREQLLIAMIALLLGLGCYWLVVYGATRSDYTLLFVCHITATVGYQITYDGVLLKFTNLEATFLQQTVTSLIFLGFATYFGIRFISAFLSLDEHLPRVATFYKWFSNLILAILCIAPSCYFFDWADLLDVVIGVAVLFATFFGLIVTTILMLRGVRAARYYFVGAVSVTAATWTAMIDYYLTFFDPTHAAGSNLIHLVYYGGLSFRYIVVAVGIGDLFRIEREENLRLKANYSDQLEADIKQRTQQITEQNQLLEMQSKRLEQLSKDRSSYLAGASHDLRQPLHAMRIFAESIEPKITDETARHSMGLLRDMLANMTHMFSSILDASRLDAGAAKPEISTVPLVPLFHSLQREYKELAHRKGLRLVVRPSKLHVSSDPEFLRRIIANLLANGIKYADSGGVLLAARKRGETVLIQVFDTGRGLSEAQTKVIFDDFTQVDSQNTQGVGLGLAIVRKSAEQLGHTVSVRSHPGQGSTFTICLPWVDSISKTSSEPLELPEASTSYQILVVDDTDSVLQATRQLLEDWGHHAVPASSMQAALAMSKDEPFDLFLLDVDLDSPGEGFQLLEHLRQRHQSGTYFMMTGRTDQEVLDLAEQHDVTILFKPVDPARLRSLLLSLS